jgi:hypothetical protein
LASFGETIKEHPYLVGGGVLVGVVIVFFMFRSSSSGGGTTVVRSGVRKGNAGAMFNWANRQNARNAAISINRSDNKTKTTLGLAGDRTKTTLGLAGDRTGLAADAMKTKIDLLGIGDSYKLGNTKEADNLKLGLSSINEASTLAHDRVGLEEYLAAMADKGYVQGGEAGSASGGGLYLGAAKQLEEILSTSGYGGAAVPPPANNGDHGWPGYGYGSDGFGGSGGYGGAAGSNGATGGDSSGVAGDTGSGASPAAGAGGVGAA